MQDKLNLKNNNKKGYLNIHVDVANVKTKKILAMNVTDDKHVHDSKALPKLVDDIKLDKKITIDRLCTDGSAYDANNTFRYLADKGILPYIKVRKNARVRWKKRNILSIYQL